MRRKLSLLLALALSTTLTIGCSKSNVETEGSEDKIEISVQAETSWIPYYEQAIERVKEKHSNVDIKIIETGVFDHLDILKMTDVTNEDVADVFPFGMEAAPELNNNSILASFDAPKIAEELGGYDNYETTVGEMLNVDGEYLGIPYNIETLVLFANKDNATSAGIDLGKEIEFTSLGFESMPINLFNGWFGVAFTNAADLNLLYKENDVFKSDIEKDFNELTKEQQGVFTAMFDQWKAHNDAKTDLWDKDASNGYIDTKFKEVNGAALRIDGPWATPGLADTIPNSEALEILPINKVTVNGQKLNHWKGGWALGINARIEEDSAKMEIAQELIKELLNPEYAVDLFRATGKILPNVSEDIYNASDLPEIDKKVISATIQSFEVADMRPVGQEWETLFTSWENALLSWSTTNPANVEEAYKNLQDAFKSMLQMF